MRLGAYEQARANVLQSLQICQAQSRRLGEVDCFRNLGNIARTVYDLPVARTHYEHALRLAPAMSARSIEGTILFELGDVVRLQGEYTLACDLTERALALFDEIGESRGGISPQPRWCDSRA